MWNHFALVRSAAQAKVLQGLSRSTSGDGGSNSGEQRGEKGGVCIL